MGSWKHDVRDAIRDLATQANRPMSIDFEPSPKQTFDVKIDFQRAAYDHVSQVWLALVQDNVVAKIGAGENAGRTLYEDGLVRTLIQATASDSDDAAARRYQASLTLPTGVDRADLSVVVFAQRLTDHAIVGAARKALRSDGCAVYRK